MNILQQLVYDEKNPLLFNHGFFVFFFAIFISLYFLCRNKPTSRSYIFSFFSLYFFYKASGLFVVMVILAAIFDFNIAKIIHRTTAKSKRKALLVLSIIFNLGILVYFKYTNFFIELLNNGFHSHINPLNILLPVGISFYTFENISYTFDVYKQEIKPVKSLNDYLLFLSFFPKLVMGPIVRAADFIPQINKPYHVTKEAFYEGFYLILSGLFKKLIISDFITLNYVDYIFDSPEKYTGLECLFAVYGYAVVIYCDFSGYSSVAIGIAKWLGFNIPANFRLPYQSSNLSEFWRRWHISLSSWLRDYLYIPLGGNKLGKARTYLNLIITMILGGFWHGANLTFIVWGLLHGLGLSIHKFWTSDAQFIAKKFRETKIYHYLSVLLTFHFVCLAWVYFKCNTVQQARTLLQQIKYRFSADVFISFVSNYKLVLGMIILGLLIQSINEKYYQPLLNKCNKLGLIGAVSLFVAFAILYTAIRSSTVVLPIYLKF